MILLSQVAGAMVCLTDDLHVEQRGLGAVLFHAIRAMVCFSIVLFFNLFKPSFIITAPRPQHSLQRRQSLWIPNFVHLSSTVLRTLQIRLRLLTARTYIRLTPTPIAPDPIHFNVVHISQVPVESPSTGESLVLA